MRKETDLFSHIGCIIMASGLSSRFGRDKLLEMLDGREVILHTALNLREAGFSPLAVTRSSVVAAVLEKEGFACILHEGEKKSDTMHAGILALDGDVSGYLFMPGDQPLTLPASLRRLAQQFLGCPVRAVRLGFANTPGSPVIFPVSFRENLLAYKGDRGGSEVLKERGAACDIVQASCSPELWDVDTPEKMERVRAAYTALRP